MTSSSSNSANTSAGNNPLDDVLVQQIVKLVIAEMQRAALVKTSAVGLLNAGNVAANTATTGTKQSDAKTKVATPSPRLIWSEKAVTWFGLRDKLHGVTEIVISPKAVVTPAVRDELKIRGIKLTRSAEAIASPERRNIELVSCYEEKKYSVSQRVRAAEPQVAHPLKATCWPGLRKEIAGLVADKKIVLFATDNVHVPLCELNRDKSLRVGLIMPGFERNMIRSLQPNVLVISEKDVTANKIRWLESVVCES